VSALWEARYTATINHSWPRVPETHVVFKPPSPPTYHLIQDQECHSSTSQSPSRSCFTWFLLARPVLEVLAQQHATTLTPIHTSFSPTAQTKPIVLIFKMVSVNQEAVEETNFPLDTPRKTPYHHFVLPEHFAQTKETHVACKPVSVEHVKWIEMNNVHLRLIGRKSWARRIFMDHFA
jgi:hypothetical protein